MLNLPMMECIFATPVRLLLYDHRNLPIQSAFMMIFRAKP